MNQIPNYIAGEWNTPATADFAAVINPATGATIAQTPMGGAAEVNAAVEAAANAYPEWRRTPPQDRIQFLFKLKRLLEEHYDEIARCISTENGKTFVEARAEVQRSVENVEVACGIPTLMQG